MNLPIPPGRVMLKSFWIAISLLIGFLCGYLLHIVFSVDWLVFGIGLALVGAIPGIFKPDVASLAYRAFNKLGRLSGHYASQAVLILCFCIMYIAMGKKRECFAFARPDDLHSLWAVKSPDDSSRSINPNGVSAMALDEGAWTASFARWAIDSGNWWMCSLLPYMFLLSFFTKKEDRSSVPASVYTLY